MKRQQDNGGRCWRAKGGENNSQKKYTHTLRYIYILHTQIHVYMYKI